MQTRLNHRVAILCLLACPLGCSPASQEKLAGAFARRGGATPSAAAQHHHHHHGAGHHHHLASGPADAPVSSVLRGKHEEQDAAQHPIRNVERNFDLADYRVSEPPPATKQFEYPEASDSPEAVATPSLPLSAAAVDSEQSGGPVDFAHASDFSWVQGRLEYRHRTREWHVRYAPPWHEDRYGGSLVVQGFDAKTPLKEGDWVRLSGTVQGSADDGPVYQVDHADVLERASASTD